MASARRHQPRDRCAAPPAPARRDLHLVALAPRVRRRRREPCAARAARARARCALRAARERQLRVPARARSALAAPARRVVIARRLRLLRQRGGRSARHKPRERARAASPRAPRARRVRPRTVQARRRAGGAHAQRTRSARAAPGRARCRGARSAALRRRAHRDRRGRRVQCAEGRARRAHRRDAVPPACYGAPRDGHAHRAVHDERLARAGAHLRRGRPAPGAARAAALRTRRRGRIRAIHSVLATRKLRSVPFPA